MYVPCLPPHRCLEIRRNSPETHGRSIRTHPPTLTHSHTHTHTHTRTHTLTHSHQPRQQKTVGCPLADTPTQCGYCRRARPTSPPTYIPLAYSYLPTHTHPDTGGSIHERRHDSSPPPAARAPDRPLLERQHLHPAVRPAGCPPQSIPRSLAALLAGIDRLLRPQFPTVANARTHMSEAVRWLCMLECSTVQLCWAYLVALLPGFSPSGFSPPPGFGPASPAQRARARLGHRVTPWGAFTGSGLVGWGGGGVDERVKGGYMGGCFFFSRRAIVLFLGGFLVVRSPLGDDSDEPAVGRMTGADHMPPRCML